MVVYAADIEEGCRTALNAPSDDREDVERMRSYLAEHRRFFGDFDLIFGASRLGPKIVDVPMAYRDRVYGSTNISRWSHGLLLRMPAFAALRLRFI